MEKTAKELRYEKYCEDYPEQVRLMGYINSLEKDNANINDAEIITNRQKRRAKKLVKINNKDIKKYQKMLELLPQAPEFK
ncbi:MAG: hypothetical protein LBC71_00535 [Oscillospiraceae bacterium]|jgi:hypothetical protein|nr:hypothetical protein [Oscillospiraceae bacterium]